MCIPVLLIIIAYTHMLHAMEHDIELQPLSSTPIDIVATLNFKINHHFDNRYFPHLINNEDIVNIVDITAEHSSLDDRSIMALYHRNGFFRQAINTITKNYKEEIQNVTSDSLIFIEKNQSTALPTNLPPALQKFIIHHTYQNIPARYTMDLERHRHEISSFDIHADTHTAVTASNDGTTCIWDLQRGVFRHSIQSKSPMSSLCFNNAGSRIASVTKSSNSLYKVQEWDATSGQELCSLEMRYPTISINYMQQTTKNILIIYMLKNNYLIQALWKTITHNNQPSPEGIIYSPIINTNNTIQYAFSSKVKGQYSANHPQLQLFNKNVLSVTKNGCYDVYFCYQALKNSSHDKNALNKIMQSQSYKKLTEYEKKLLH